MSGRNYISGAQKRKLASEKKQKNEEELKKIPKITAMFSAEPSTSTAITESQNEMTTEEIETQKSCDDLGESIGEIGGDISSMNLSVDDDLDERLSNVSVASFDHTTYRYPTDVALWDISTDSANLQRYWSKLGTFSPETISEK